MSLVPTCRKAARTSVAWTLRQITPRWSGSQDAEDAIEHTTVVYLRNATRLVGQHRLYGSSFILASSQRMIQSPVWEFESQASGQTRCWPCSASALLGRSGHQPIDNLRNQPTTSV